MLQDTRSSNGIFLNKKQMTTLEKSITLAVSLKVAVSNVKYIFNIDILVNQKQNNISSETSWLRVFQFLKAGVQSCSEKKVFLKISPCNFTEKGCSTDVFLRILPIFYKHLFLEICKQLLLSCTL